jgi:hypothetical protein
MVIYATCVYATTFLEVGSIRARAFNPARAKIALYISCIHHFCNIIPG